MGIIPQDEMDLIARQAEEQPEGSGADLSDNRGDQTQAQEVTFKLEGMWCPACAWLVQEVLKRIEGVLEAEVFFLSDTARVRYLPYFVGSHEIMGRVSSLGYQSSPFQDYLGEATRGGDALLRLGISSFLTANLMMISFALYLGFFQDLSQKTISYLSYPLWLLATPVIFYGGFPILRRAFIGFRHVSFSMETLISLGALSAYSYSIIQLMRGGIHLYFDTAAMLVTLVLVGKYVETQARTKVSGDITELHRLASQKVRICDGRKERWFSSEAVRPGHVTVVRQGERVPVDGRIILGRADLDESILTGESRPVRKVAGDGVIGGALVIEGELRLKATRVGRDSSIGQMIHLMQEALTKKNPMERLADRITRWLVPVILLIAISTATYLWTRGANMNEALLRALTVLVITCPCALGIAVPLAKVAAIGLGRVCGLLVQDPVALERAKDLDTLVFDKTGTLTRGDFTLQEVIAWGDTAEESLQLVASVETHSDHYLAREVCRQARGMALRIQPARHFEIYEGLGVAGHIQGKEVFVGNQTLMSCQGIRIPSIRQKEFLDLASKGATVVFFAWDGEVRGCLIFGDTIKNGAENVIDRLQEKGFVIWLVSGDAKQTTQAVAANLGIRHFDGQMLPQDKVELVKMLQAEGQLVGMVGDGINDAAALAQADVGFALGSGLNIAQEASDIIIMSQDPAHVVKALHLSNLTMRTIRQNLLFAFIYNALAVPLAVGGIVSPLVAVFAMFASSLTVIGNTKLQMSATRIQ
jgi:heavy metal translocating P-type ATPase